MNTNIISDCYKTLGNFTSYDKKRMIITKKTKDIIIYASFQKKVEYMNSLHGPLFSAFL